MKNIHILPTDKPSRLGYITEIDKYYIFTNGENPNDIADNLANYRNIYITSDEEIKDYWVLNTHTNEVYFLKGFYGIQPITKKIILTTDQDLIKDGVQAIDDEFLEWFVKNPSCEEVEVINEQYTQNYHKDIWYNRHKIIIPKEEPKQKYESECICDTECRGFTNVKCKKPKQETLEEAAERYDTLDLNADLHFIAGAKWQQEQDKNKYSEEDIDCLLDYIRGNAIETNQGWQINGIVYTNKELLEKFKKK